MSLVFPFRSYHSWQFVRCLGIYRFALMAWRLGIDSLACQSGKYSWGSELSRSSFIMAKDPTVSHEMANSFQKLARSQGIQGQGGTRWTWNGGNHSRTGGVEQRGDLLGRSFLFLDASNCEQSMETARRQESSRHSTAQLAAARSRSIVDCSSTIQSDSSGSLSATTRPF